MRIDHVSKNYDELGSSFIATGSEIEYVNGVTRIGGDPVSIRVANNVQHNDGVHDVVVHGAPY